MTSYFLASANIFEPNRAAERLGWARVALLADAVSSHFRRIGYICLTAILDAWLHSPNRSLGFALVIDRSMDATWAYLHAALQGTKKFDQQSWRAYQPCSFWRRLFWQSSWSCKLIYQIKTVLKLQMET